MSLRSPSTGFAVLRNRNFAYYLSARVLGTLAVQMQSVAIDWQVYEITSNLFDLGLIALAIRRHVGAFMFGGVALFGMATLVLGATTSFAIALGALFLLGVGDEAAGASAA